MATMPALRIEVDTSALDALDDRIKRVEVMSVQPDDIIVLTVEPCSEEEVEELRFGWLEATGLPNKTVILGGATVQVVRPDTLR